MIALLTLLPIFVILVVFITIQLSPKRFSMKYLVLALVLLTTLITRAELTKDDFLLAINQYDDLVRINGQSNKNYDHIPPTAGKIAAVSMWSYGVYIGIRKGDLYKVAMATLAGAMFGISVAAVTKMLVNSSYYIKLYYSMYRLEKKIHEIAHELHLTINDIAQINSSSFTSTTQQMLGELQLDLLLQ